MTIYGPVWPETIQAVGCNPTCCQFSSIWVLIPLHKLMIYGHCLVNSRWLKWQTHSRLSSCRVIVVSDRVALGVGYVDHPLPTLHAATSWRHGVKQALLVQP